jgi:hypothetical protein
VAKCIASNYAKISGQAINSNKYVPYSWHCYLDLIEKARNRESEKYIQVELYFSA